MHGILNLCLSYLARCSTCTPENPREPVSRAAAIPELAYVSDYDLVHMVYLQWCRSKCRVNIFTPPTLASDIISALNNIPDQRRYLSNSQIVNLISTFHT